MYRTLPSAVHEPFHKIDNGLLLKDMGGCEANPNQMRWQPPALPHNPTDFVQGSFPFFFLIYKIYFVSML